MADAQRTIELIFEGVNKTGAATQAVISNTEKFAGNVQSATQPVADLTKSALKLEAALLVAGAGATAFAVKLAGDFDTSFREISTLINQPIDDLGEFRQAILSYASSSTAPLEEVTQSIYNAISAGVDFEDSIEAVSRAEQLSVAGKAELNSSLLVLVSSLNAYGLEMDQAERFSDLLFQTVRSGQTTLPELAGSLANVTGIAATAGVDFEELLAAIATLTATGTPTAQAVTQVRGALAAILKPTSEASTLAKDLGLNFSLQRLEAVGLSGILQDVQQATGGNAEEMAKLFGSVEALNGVLTLTGLGADRFAETLLAMANPAGVTEAAFDKMSDSIGLAGQKIQNALEGLLVGIGDPLLDEFGGVAEAISGIFRALGESVAEDDAGLNKLVDFIESQMAGLQETLEQVARTLPAALDQADFSGFINGVVAVTESVQALFEDIDLTTPEGLATAIEVLGSAFEGLSEFTAGVIDSFGPLFDQLVKITGEVEDLDSGVFRTAGEIAGFATQANILSGALVDMLPVIEAVVALIGINQATGLIKSVIGAKGAIGGVGAGLVGSLGSLGLAAGALAVGGAIGTVANELTELATGTSLSTRLVDAVIGFGLLDDEATRIAEGLNSVTSPALDKTGDAAEKAGKKVEESAEGFKVFEPLVPTVEMLPTIFTEAGDAASDLERKAAPLEGTFNVISFGIDNATDSTRALQDATDELKLEATLALIASRTEIVTTQIEANAEQMVAAFESVDTGIESTGDLLSSLFDNLADVEGISDRFAIEEQIRRENELRQAEFDRQERLINAQIRALDAQTERLRGGEALLTVDGAGLQPHLEAFMFEILDAIQVRLSQAGLGVLLGLNP